MMSKERGIVFCFSLRVCCLKELSLRRSRGGDARLPDYQLLDNGQVTRLPSLQWKRSHKVCTLAIQVAQGLGDAFCPVVFSEVAVPLLLFIDSSFSRSGIKRECEAKDAMPLKGPHRCKRSSSQAAEGSRNGSLNGLLRWSEVPSL